MCTRIGTTDGGEICQVVTEDCRGPEISVIVPVYKVEPYLRRCVDSILAQTFRGFELILVDDGSPDRCGEICDEYAQKDHRVVVLHQENAGLSAARNAGIDWAFANSKSEYLTFIDSDDWVLPNYLECLHSGILLSGSVACCGCQEFDDSNRLCKIDIQDTDWRVVSTREYWLQLGYTMTAWGKLYAKWLFEDIRYPVGKVHEDEYITHRVLFKRDCMAETKSRLYCYYRRSDSITKSPPDTWSLDYLGGLEDQHKMFLEMKDDELVAMLEKRLVPAYCAAIAIRPCRDFRMKLRHILELRQIKMVASPVAYKCVFPVRFCFAWPFVRVVDFVNRRGFCGSIRYLWGKRS